MSPYAEAKLKAFQDYVQGYRERYRYFISSGILFNHESPRRGEHFVTRKVTVALAKIKLGMLDTLRSATSKRAAIGDMRAIIGGDALMLQQKKADDYVIGTGSAIRSVT